MSNLKIGFVFDDSLDRPDGVQQYLLTVGDWLIKQGHEVHYLVGQTKRRDIANVHSLSRNVSVPFNGNRLSVPLPASRPAIAELLAVQKFDVLHVQLPCSPWMAGRVVAAAPVSTHVVGTFHILPYSKLERLAAKALYLATRNTLSRLDATCSVSIAAQSYARSGFGLESVVIPNAVDVQSFGHAKTEQHTQRRIVFLGRLVDRKGCGYLLRAIRRLSVQHKLQNIQVIICGDGPLRPALEAYVDQHNLGDVVRFEGFVTEDQKRQQLSGADIAVFPSLSGESFGIVLIEAMAAGAGVVLGGDNPGYRSVLGEHPQLLVNPRNTAQFAERIDLLLNDGQLRQTLQDWQKQTIKQYDIEAVGSRLLALYKPQG